MQIIVLATSPAIIKLHVLAKSHGNLPLFTRTHSFFNHFKFLKSRNRKCPATRYGSGVVDMSVSGEFNCIKTLEYTLIA